MVENEVKNYDGQMNLNPIEPQHFGQITSAPVESVELTSCLQEVSNSPDMRFARRKLVRRVKAAGIF